MEKSKTVVEITKALLEAQKEIGTIVRNREASYPTKGGGRISYTYADLAAVIDAVKEPLNNNSILLLQAVDAGNGTGGQAVVETILTHTSGEYFSSRTPIYCAASDPKAFGSGMSYAKRYGLLAMLGLPTEDDDGDAAGKKKKKLEPPKFTEDEKETLALICASLLETLEKGKAVDEDKVAAILFGRRGRYPSDTAKAGAVAAWLISLGKKESWIKKGN